MTNKNTVFKLHIRLMRGGMRWMYRGVDGSITEEDWAGQTHQLHFLLPRRRFFASPWCLRVGGNARGEGVSWFLVQLKSTAPVLPIRQI